MVQATPSGKQIDFPDLDPCRTLSLDRGGGRAMLGGRASVTLVDLADPRVLSTHCRTSSKYWPVETQFSYGSDGLCAIAQGNKVRRERVIASLLL